MSLPFIAAPTSVVEETHLQSNNDIFQRGRGFYGCRHFAEHGSSSRLGEGERSRAWAVFCPSVLRRNGCLLFLLLSLVCVVGGRGVS
jgi:hypothetical protein